MCCAWLNFGKGWWGPFGLEGDGAGCATFLRDANAVLSAFDEPPLPFRLVAINN
jgi:hypothetical protein